LTLQHQWNLDIQLNLDNLLSPQLRWKRKNQSFLGHLSNLDNLLIRELLLSLDSSLILPGWLILQHQLKSDNQSNLEHP
jgi:hypothetical protein